MQSRSRTWTTLACVLLSFAGAASAGLPMTCHPLYAGDAPGDGFTAGVIGGISIALWYQVFGYDRARLRQANHLFDGAGTHTDAIALQTLTAADIRASRVLAAR